MALVEQTDLEALLQRSVPAASATLAVQLAEADLRPVVRSRTWPETRTGAEDLWAAVLKLAVLYVENPTAMRSTTTGGTTDDWDTAARRAEIITEVTGRYGGTGPVGSFPPAQPWPDPTSVPFWRCW